MSYVTQFHQTPRWVSISSTCSKYGKFSPVEYAISELSFASVSKRVFERNHSDENVFHSQAHFHVNEIHFHMKIVLKHMVTLKWVIIE